MALQSLEDPVEVLRWQELKLEVPLDIHSAVELVTTAKAKQNNEHNTGLHQYILLLHRTDTKFTSNQTAPQEVSLTADVVWIN